MYDGLKQHTILLKLSQIAQTVASILILGWTLSHIWEVSALGIKWPMSSNLFYDYMS